MRIMVLGGCGLIGSCAVRDLAETSDAEVIIGDRNFSKAVKLAEKIKSQRILTLPISFKDKGVRNVDWMEGEPGFVNYQLLVNMNLASGKPIKFKNMEIIPREFVNAVLEATGLLGFPENVIPNDWEVSKVIVDGKLDGKKATYTLEAIWPPKKEWGASCSQYSVGAPGSIVAQMIAKGCASTGEMC